MWLKFRISLVVIGLSLALNVAAAAPVVTCPNGSMAGGVSADDYRLQEGRKIATVVYRTVPVFDPDDPRENNALYQFLNRIHSNTKDQVIADQLLFAAGDSVKTDTIAETERLLRAMPYLKDAEIRTVGDCGADGVVLQVSVRDVWTLEPQINIGREGGENHQGYGLAEQNLFGSGNSVSVGYSKDAERSGMEYGFKSPHLLNTRLDAELAFSDTSDGQQRIVDVGLPFYSLETPWAAGLRNEDLSSVNTILYKGEHINAFDHKTEYHEAYVGVAVNVTPAHTQRVLIGLTGDNHNFAANENSVEAIPASFHHEYPWLEYRFIENNFAEYRNLNQMHRVEDLSLGLDLRIRVGQGGKYFNDEKDFTQAEFSCSDLFTLSENHLMELQFSTIGKYFSKDSDQTQALTGAKMAYYYLDGDNDRWYVSASYYQGYQLPQYLELTAGGRDGLRGYPLDYLRGDKRYLATIEKRYITDAHVFNIFRFGMAMYLDMGKAWGDDYPNAPQLANVGLGLRMSSSKAKIGNILHLDLAVPLVERDQVSRFQLVMRASKSL